MAHKVRPRLHYPGVYLDSHKHERLGLPAFMLWQYLVDHADDDGRQPVLPSMLASAPYLLVEGSARSIEEVEGYLAELERRRLLRLYLVAGVRYCELHDFNEYQRVRPRDYKKSNYPGPPDGRQPAAEWQPDGRPMAANRLPDGRPKDKDNVKDKDNGRPAAGEAAPLSGARSAEEEPEAQPPAPEPSAQLAAAAAGSPAQGVALAQHLQAHLKQAHPRSDPGAGLLDADNLRLVVARVPEPELRELIAWAARHQHWGPVLLARGGPGVKLRQHLDTILSQWEAERRPPEDRAREEWRAQERQRRERLLEREARGRQTAHRGESGGGEVAPGDRQPADFTTAREALTGILASLRPGGKNGENLKT